MSVRINGGIVTESVVDKPKWSLEDYQSFFDQAQEALLRGFPDLVGRAERLLGRYRGIPTSIDMFEILGLHGDEDTHTEFLAWLLQPAANHGAGSAFLRGFLALIPDTGVGAVASRSNLGEVFVRTQWQLQEGVPDLVIFIEAAPKRGLALIVEAKIHARLTNRRGQPQTLRYVQSLSTQDQLQDSIIVPFENACGHKFESVRVHYVFLRANPDQNPDPNHNDSKTSVWLTVDYAAVERMVGEIANEIDLPIEVRHVINQFRTSLLAGALPEDCSLQAVQSLRELWFNRRHMPKLTVATRMATLIDQLEDTDGN